MTAGPGSISFHVFAAQGATAVAGAGITQSICLPLLSVYQLSSNGTVQVSAGGLSACTSRGKCAPAPLGSGGRSLSGWCTARWYDPSPPTLSSSKRSARGKLMANLRLKPRILVSLLSALPLSLLAWDPLWSWLVPRRDHAHSRRFFFLQAGFFLQAALAAVLQGGPAVPLSQVPGSRS